MSINKTLLVLSIVLSIFLSRPVQSHAWSLSFWGNSNPRPPVYSVVVVGNNRYYYNQGIFYTGSPGNYVVVEAPDGAIINDVPVGYESVVVGGNPYYRYHNVYYRHGAHGYQVVHNVGAHDQGQHGGDEHDHR